MRCRFCSSESPEDSRFCIGCGKELRGGCHSCGGPLPPEARFCPGCGAPQASAMPPADAPASEESSGERRQLTVMFCDLVGSSELAGRLGAEAYVECLRRYQEACGVTIERFEGTVAQLLGDGILVYFGHPRAHEDDAERAVRAGLELLLAIHGVSRWLTATFGVELAARIGVHTGPVVVGAVRSGARRETLALGDTMNIAARVQGEAEPNGLVVTETTKRLVEGLFLMRELGAPALKGIARPIRLYAVEGRSGPRARLSSARHLCPMVDRTEELRFLLRTWEEAVGGSSRFVSIGGEPGLGKSRIVSRFRERVGSAEHHWLSLRCSPLESAGALHPWIDHLRDHLDISESEAPEGSLLRLRRGLERLGSGVDEVAERFARLLGIALPEQSGIGVEAVELARHRALEALLRWVEALAEERPVVLLIEDLHWSDPSTIQWIRMLIDRSVSLRLLCLMTHRPEFQAPWASTALASLTLAHLGEDHARELAHSASGEASLPPELIEAIVERADGVPLFLEELAKMASESHERGPGESFEIPSTLRDLLMARLDRLGTAKRVAQIGAVIGRDFTHELLCEIARPEVPQVERELDRLLDSGLVFRSGVPPDAAYTFKHALVQDTAYDSLLVRRRQELHGAAAVALSGRAERGVDVPPAVLGHHWRGAQEWLAAAEQFLAAGRRAVGLAAFEEAIQHYREGLAAAARAPASLERPRCELSLNILLGNALMSVEGFHSPECREVWQRAEALAQVVDDPDELSSARNGAAVYYLTTGDLAEAERYARLVLEVGPRGDARVSGLRGHMSLASIDYFRGRGPEAYAHAERSIALARPSDFWTVTYGANLDQGVAAYGMSAMSLAWLGRLDDALARAEQGLAWALDLASPLSIALARSTVWLVSIDRGDFERQRDEAAALHDLAAELSLPLWLGFAKLAQGFLRACSGDREGIARMMEGVALQGETVGQNGATMGICLLAAAHLGVGDHVAAEELVDAGLALAEAQGIACFLDQLRILKAEIALARDPSATDVARETLLRACASARERGAKLFEVRAAVGLAKLLHASGEDHAARELLAESAQGFQGEETAEGRAIRSLLREMAPGA